MHGYIAKPYYYVNEQMMEMKHGFTEIKENRFILPSIHLMSCVLLSTFVIILDSLK